MAKSSFLVRAEVTITRQEGDTGSIEFIIPATIDMTGMDVIFEVQDVDEQSVFKKESDVSETQIEIDLADSRGQYVAILLDGTETKGFAATDHRWELQVSDGDDIITVGKGTFVIQSEVIDEGFS